VTSLLTTMIRRIVCIRSTYPTYLIWVGVLLALSNSGSATADTTLEDPLFSASYDAQQVHFDQVPTKELLPACRKLLADIDPLPAKLTLFAKHTAASSRIYIAGIDDNVKILVVREGHCAGGIPILSLLQRHHSPPDSADTPVLSDAEVGEVFSDTLARYSKAFDGKARFLQWLDATTEKVIGNCKGPEQLCAPTYHSFTPLLKNLLERYRKAE